MPFVLIYNYKLTNNRNYDKIYYVNHKCIFKIKERENKTIIVLWVLTMKKKSYVRKLVICIVLALVVMLAGCGSKDVTTSKEANEETTVVAIKPWKYNYKGEKFIISNELIADRIHDLKIESGQTVYANDFVDEGVDAGDLLRGEFVYDLLKFMGLDAESFKIDHDGGRDTILLPYDENFTFTNTTGKSFYLEYVGVDDIDYYFDFYALN